MPRCEMCDEWPDCPWKTDPEIMCGEYHPKPMTNADRVRGMTDEELADFIGTHDCLDCPLNNEYDWCAGPAGSCRGNVLGWLKAPAEQEAKE